MPIKHIKGKDLYEEIKKSELPIHVAKFSASWCNPCVHASNFIKSLEAEGKLNHAVIYEIDCEDDDSVDLSTRLGIRALPTFIKFSKDDKHEALDTRVGAASTEDILNFCKA